MARVGATSGELVFPLFILLTIYFNSMLDYLFFFILLSVSHVIADYYGRTPTIQRFKHTQIKYLLLHGLLYLLILVGPTSLLVILFRLSLIKFLVILPIVTALLHVLVDYYTGYWKDSNSPVLSVTKENIIDQIIHLLLLAITVLVLIWV